MSARDRQFLADQTREGRAVSARTWKRIRILELLHEQWTLADVAAAVGTYPREVRRVGWRYLDRGVQEALTDDPRPKPPKLLDTRQQAAFVAMVCTPPPAGYARWMIRVTTAEAKRRCCARETPSLLCLPDRQNGHGDCSRRAGPRDAGFAGYAHC